MRHIRQIFIVRLFVPFILCGSFSFLAHAEELFVPAELKVEGLQRVTLARVLSVTDLRSGRLAGAQSVADAIKNIYATGYFQDVKILRSNNTLIIRVEEHPAVSALEIKGNKLIKTENLEDAMKQNGVEVGRIFPYGRFELILQELKALYAEQGRYGASIESEVSELDGNRIEILINIDEGKPTQISQINILGNQFFRERQLLDLLLLKQRTNWNGNSRKTQYSRQSLLADLETMRNHYLDAGFARVRIEDTVVSIDNNKKFINIGIYIMEGKRYKIGNVRIAGNLILPEEQLVSQLAFRTDEIFSQRKITESTRAITRTLGNEGYGLARVNPSYQFDEVNGKINITLYVRPGEKTYVRHIRFVGNKKSKHTRLRRVLPQLEGAHYSSELISLSLSRLRRLPYLQNAEVTTRAVPGRSDRVDLIFTVTEAPSGSISGGLVYNDLTGVSLTLDFSDRNLFGSGNSLTTSISYSNVRQLFSVSYTQPFVTPNGVSASYFLRLRNLDFNQASLGSYGIQSSALGVDFGYPVSEYERVSYGFDFDAINVGLGSGPSQEVVNYTDTYGTRYNDVGISTGYSYNNLDSGFKPTSGNSVSLRLNLKVPTEQEKERERSPYYQASMRQQTFLRLHREIKELIFFLGTRVSYLDNLNTREAIPFYEHYYAGGIGTVRGYGVNSLGPRATLSGGSPSLRSQGGNLRTIVNMELIFPIPRLTSDATGLRTSLFWDAGNVFNTRCIYEVPHCEIPIAYNQLRQSYGFSLRWQIQFVPLTFVFARPINPKEGDITDDFQFTLGSVF